MFVLSTTPKEKASKSHTRVLQAFTPNGTATALAVALGTNDKKISEFKNTDLEFICLILAHLNLKIVGADEVTVPKETLEQWKGIAKRAVDNDYVMWGVE